MMNRDSSDLKRQLSELAGDIRELDLPQQRVEYKRLLFKAQELRLQLIYLGEIAAVNAFDEQTVSLGTSETEQTASAIASKTHTEKTDEMLEMESDGATREPPVTGFTLPVSFLIPQNASASPINDEVSSVLPALGGNMNVPRVFIQ